MATTKSAQSKPPQAPSRTRSTSTSKQSETPAAQAKTHKGHPLPHSQPVSTAGVPLPTDELASQLQAEQDQLHEPGRVAKGLGDQIDNSPGYNKDQLAHMAEYFGDDERDEPGK